MKVTINMSGYGQQDYEFNTLPNRGEALYVAEFTCRSGEIKNFRCMVKAILHSVSHLEHTIIIVCDGRETE